MPTTFVYNLLGQRFGRLIATDYQSGKWVLQCDCGGIKRAYGKDLRKGRVKSCGCLRYQGDHGYCGSPTYNSWVQMKSRCSNPNIPDWEDYGAKGITVCERWMKFENFLEDMGERLPNTTLDRINSRGDYEKTNCRWATVLEQARNTSWVKLELHEPNQIRWLAETYTRAEIARYFDMSWQNINAIVKGRAWKD